MKKVTAFAQPVILDDFMLCSFPFGGLTPGDARAQPSSLSARGVTL